jgi:hypothetical protein
VYTQNHELAGTQAELQGILVAVEIAWKVTNG